MGFLNRMGAQGISLLNNVRPFNTVAILMYHNVTNDAAASYRSIRTQDFRDQMLYLKEKCEVLTMGDLVRIYKSRQNLPKTGKPRVIITLDDGFRDNYENAFPVLKEFGLPATVFIISKLISWEGYKEDRAGRLHLNLVEMKEMHNHGITFCSHTYSHPNLSKMMVESQRMEIKKGMDDLYDHFADPEVLEVFAYPFGEYNQSTLDILQELKVRVGLTVWHHLNGSMENPLRLKRLTADGRDGLFKFAAQINPYVFQVYQWHLNRALKQAVVHKNVPTDESRMDAKSLVFDI